MKIELDGIVFMEEVSGAEGQGAQLAATRVIPVAAKREVKALDYCLDLWLRWQRQDDSRLGWRGKCAMIESDYDEDEDGDVEALYSGIDVRIAEAVEAMMRGLPRHLDWALRQRCGVATVWNFPSLIFEDVLGDAEQALEVLLRKNVATRTLFV